MNFILDDLVKSGEIKMDAMFTTLKNLTIRIEADGKADIYAIVKTQEEATLLISVIEKIGEIADLLQPEPVEEPK